MNFLEYKVLCLRIRKLQRSSKFNANLRKCKTLPLACCPLFVSAAVSRCQGPGILIGHSDHTRDIGEIVTCVDH